MGKNSRNGGYVSPLDAHKPDFYKSMKNKPSKLADMQRFSSERKTEKESNHITGCIDALLTFDATKRE